MDGNMGFFRGQLASVTTGILLKNRASLCVFRGGTWLNKKNRGVDQCWPSKMEIPSNNWGYYWTTLEIVSCWLLVDTSWWSSVWRGEVWSTGALSWAAVAWFIVGSWSQLEPKDELLKVLANVHRKHLLLPMINRKHGMCQWVLQLFCFRNRHPKPAKRLDFLFTVMISWGKKCDTFFGTIHAFLIVCSMHLFNLHTRIVVNIQHFQTWHLHALVDPPTLQKTAQ